jgi:hypothetical protein
MKIGRIYKIIHNQSNIVYVGSTFNTLRDRWKVHKQAYTKYLKGKGDTISIYPYFKDFSIENFKIVLIKEYDVVDKKHLYVYEALWIYKLKSVNKIFPFHINKIYRKEYRKANLEKIKKYQKSYQEKNKEEINLYQKDYRTKNKEKLNEYFKKVYEKNKQERKIKDQTRYEKNKSTILGKCKLYNQKNKEKYYCLDCDYSTYSKNNFTKHLNKKTHFKFVLPVGLII